MPGRLQGLRSPASQMMPLTPDDDCQPQGWGSSGGDGGSDEGGGGDG